MTAYGDGRSKRVNVTGPWAIAPHFLLAACWLILALMLGSGCAGRPDGTAGPAMAGALPAASTGLAQALKELDALPVPAGCDAQTFVELKSSLRRILCARQVSKFTSAAPGSILSQVMDLAVQDYGGSPRFHWSYASEGDYNQDSVVNVQDLALLGIHWLKDSAAADWASARVADGNANGKVEIGDLTSIGANYLCLVAGYHLQRSDTEDAGGTWEQVADIEFGASSVPAGEPRRFEYAPDSAAAGYYRVVPFDGASDGIPGNAVHFVGTLPGAWPMSGHDAQHTRRSPYHGPATGAQKWSFATGGPILSSPAIGEDGTLYVGSTDTKLHAINSDGTLKWAFLTEGGMCSSPAISDDGTVYFGGNDGKFYAVNPDGSLKWIYDDIVAADITPTLTADGTIYIGTGPHKLDAINLDGTLKWACTTGTGNIHEPAIGPDGTIYGGGDSMLYAVSPEGSLRWGFTGEDYFYPAPAIGVEGTIYACNYDGKIYAINLDGSMKWAYATAEKLWLSPAIGMNDTVYAGVAKLFAINPDGSLKWIYDDPAITFCCAPAIDADGVIYIGVAFIADFTGQLYAIRPDGSLKWSSPLEGYVHWLSSPAIGADGTIYVGDSAGVLNAIGPGGG